MEAVNRQSGVHSLINRDHYYPPTMSSERDQQPPHTSITTPSAMSPTSLYPNHPPPPYSQGNSAPQSAHPLSGLVSPSQPNPPDARRASGDTKDPAPHRHSLPSIHEALYTPNTMSAPRTVTVDPSPPRAYAGYPQPPPTPTSRANSIDGAPYQPQLGLAQRTSPPNPLHPSSYSRPEHMPPSPFDNPRYPPLPSIRTALPTQSSTLPGPSSEYLQSEKDLRAIAPVSAGYPQQSPHNSYPSNQPTNGPNPGSTPAYSPQSPYLPQRPYRGRYEYDEVHSKIGENPVTQKVYGPVVKRHLDYWDIEMDLNNMKNCGEEVSRISSLLLADAQRNTHHGSMPERMPSIHDIDLIRIQQEKLAQSIQRVAERVVAQGQYQERQNGVAQSGKAAEDYSQEELNWDDGRNMGGYGGPDAKKRRGRAAPPGRCHSCNRAETPEWRRGPDGARTLCNACGLHYAKLTRKLGSKQAQNGGSTLRPSSMGDVSPRS